MSKIHWKSKEALYEEQLQAKEEMERREALRRGLLEAPQKIASLEEENMSLMLAAAETYEQMYSENMTLMLAVAEMYEEMQKIKGGTP